MLLIKILIKFSPGRKPKRIIILAFGGIGNHLMLTPAINNLKNSFPKINLHLVATSVVSARVLQNNKSIDSMSISNIGSMDKLSKWILKGYELRTLKPDAVIAAAGTDPVVGSIISFVSGARFRIGEDWHGRGFLYTHKLDANSKISEIEQNNRLISLMGAKTHICDPLIYLKEGELSDGGKWIEKQEFPDNVRIIGIHPGSGKSQIWKRWDIKKYIEVIKKIEKLQDVRILVFLGPEENDLFEHLKNENSNSTKLINEIDSIRKIAAIISHCNCFLSNDSGLRHIASALGIKTIGIFGPTSIKKNHYGNDLHKIIFNKNAICSPCHYTSWFLACGSLRPCLEFINPDEAAQTLFDNL